MAQFIDVDDSMTTLLQAADGYKRRLPNSRGMLVDTLTSFLRQVEGPPAYLSRIRLSPLLNMCMLVAIETGVLNAIVQADGQGVSAGQLAETTGRQESMIARVMRLLVVNGICDEVAAKTYRANETSRLLNDPGQVGATRNMVDLMFPIAGRLVPQLRHERGLSEFADSPGDTTPFRATYGSSMFDFFRTNAEHKAAFDDYMVGRRAGVRRQWFDYYPLKERLITGSRSQPDGVFAVDVGGGKGHDIVDLKRACPDVQSRYILQDLAPTLEDVELSAHGIDVIAHDFFQEQPIQGARVYYFRAIFHDWSDDKCRQILSHTAKVMLSGYSKIIIEDMVLPDTNASWRGASLDVLMFMMVDGIERTLDRWRQLLESAGLEISGVWHGGDGAESTIEAVLKGDAANVTPASS